MRDPGPLSALVAAVVIGALYTQGGAFQAFAGLILLAVLLTPIQGGEQNSSLLGGLLMYLNQVLTEGIQTGV
jgi:hypothetical protein